MAEYYVEMFEGDYRYSGRNRVTGHEELEIFDSIKSAHNRMIELGFEIGDFEIYEYGTNT
jgi:hypothetical protein